MFRAVCETLVKVEEFSTKFLIISITLLTFGSAISRVFGFPLPWSLELILLLFAWFAFLGASQSSRRQTHLGVDLITRYLPKRLQMIVEIINNILIIAFLFVLSYAALLLSINYAQRQITSLRISFSTVTASALVGSLLMLLSECRHIIRRIKTLTNEIAGFKRTGNGGCE